MGVAAKLTIIAITAITGVGVLAMALTPPRPLPTHQVEERKDEGYWSLVHEDHATGEAIVHDYNMSFMDCVDAMFEAVGTDWSCERQAHGRI